MDIDPIGLLFVLVGVVLGVMGFRLAAGDGWGVPTAVFLGLVPPVAAFLFGAIGLLAAAGMVGALYKASAG